jgi:hypothetical protein
MQTAVLSKSQIDQFHRDGFVVVPGAFAREDANAMEEAWWREMSELYGIERHDRSTWRQPPRDSRATKTGPLQNKIRTERLRGAIDDLLGEDLWQWPKHWGRAIATFPQGGVWDVPGTGVGNLWHWDSPIEWDRDGPCGVRAFAFVGAVGPGGGGTSILTGSHHLLRLWEEEMSRGLRGDIHTLQRDWFHCAHPWLKALTHAASSPADRRKMFMEDGVEIGGIHVRVVELTGEPGDMVLCQPAIVHTKSPNCGTWPRFMRIGLLETERLKRIRAGK